VWRAAESACRQVAVDDRSDGALDYLQEVRQIVISVQPDMQLSADGLAGSVDTHAVEADVTDVWLDRSDRELCAPVIR
jgi:hypothetical protein